MIKNTREDQDIIKTIDQGFVITDDLRAKNLKGLRQIQTVKHKTLTREYKRLQSRLGDDHPRVKKIANRLSVDQARFKVFDEEIEKLDIQVPVIDIHTWMLHGRVLNQDRKGIKGLTIGLYDEDGNWQQELGYTCTDQKGYFALKYKITSTEKEKLKADKSKSIDAKFETMPLFIGISNQEQKMIYKGKNALIVRPGMIDYQEIVLDEESVCVPPSGGENNVPHDVPDVWYVKGMVTDEKKQGMADLTISLYDKELLFDDRLGETKTNEKGEFEIIYRTEDFRGLIESKRDLYLKVIDTSGNVLYSTKKAFRFGSRQMEKYNIQIKRQGKDKE